MTEYEKDNLNSEKEAIMVTPMVISFWSVSKNISIAQYNSKTTLMMLNLIIPSVDYNYKIGLFKFKPTNRDLIKILKV